MSKTYELSYTAERIDEMLKEVDEHTIYSDATTEEHGLMSTTDKTKLDALPTAQQIEGSLNAKVDKEADKGLSKNDYTDADKAKVASALQTETDPTVPSWAKQQNKPSYNYSEIGNTPDLSGFITKSVNDLTNYYLKSETYTKDEVAALIGAIQQFHYEIYQTLPSSGESNVLYLIGPTGSGSDRYEEYVYANNAFTKIGDTSIDLSGYVTTSALNTVLADYTTTANLTTLLTSKADKVSNATNGNFAGLDANGNLTDSGFSGDSFIKGVKQNGTAIQPVNGVVNVTVTNGKSAYDLYVDSLPAGATPLSQEEWLISLKANIGEFLFVPTDAAAATAMATFGQTYPSAIDSQGKNVAPTQDTLSVILLMNDDATTPSKTMMIATQEVTPATTPASYEFVYVGDLQSSMPSDVLTDDDIDNSFAGGSGKVAGANEVKELKQKLDINKGWFYRDERNITSAVTRTLDVNIADYGMKAGDKIIIKATNIEGDGTKYNASWVNASNEATTIFTGKSFGYMSDILTIPEGIERLRFFLSNNPGKCLAEVFNPVYDDYLVNKIVSVGGVNYLSNRKEIVLEGVAEVSDEKVVVILSANDAEVANLSGTIYAEINIDAEFNEYVQNVANPQIKFEATDGSYEMVNCILDLRDRSVFKIFNDKSLRTVSIMPKTIKVSGAYHIRIFAVDDATIKITHPLYGKKIMCFGDSVTQFKTFNDKRYSDYLAELSFAEVFNIGIGGTRLSSSRAIPTLTPTNNQEAVVAFDMSNLISAWCDSDGSQTDYQYQLAALNSGFLTSEQQTLYEAKLVLLQSNPIDTIDIVTIFGGSNDYNGQVEIGNESIDNVDKSTVFGAINTIISKIYTAKNTIRVYGFTSLLHMYVDEINNEISNANSSNVKPRFTEGTLANVLLPDYIEGVIDAYKCNNIPVCKWYWDLGFNTYNFAEYYTDFSHPQKGFYRIAERMYRFLLSN